MTSTQALDPEKVKDYLLRHGWEESPHANPSIVVFKASSVSGIRPVSLVLPKEPGVLDKESEMGLVVKAVRFISSFYDIPDLSLKSLFARVLTDKLLPRVVTPPVKADLIPYGKAVAFLGLLEKAIQLSASLERSPRPFLSRVSPIATLRPDQFNFGHTDRGSFVFSIESRAEFSNEGQSEDFALNRKILERIMRGLYSTQLACKSSSDQPLIENYVQGFNSNLCEVFAEICQTIDTSDVEFKVDWSSAIPPAKDLESLSAVMLKRDSAKLLKSASEKLKIFYAESQETIRGFVTDLNADEHLADGEFDSIQRVIKLKTLIGGRERKVEVSLSRREYQLAAQAHLAGSPLEIEGTLVRSGQNFSLVDVVRFDELPPNSIVARPKKGQHAPPITQTQSTRKTSTPRDGIITRLKRAMENQEIAPRFTFEDFHNWMREYDIRKPDGTAYPVENYRTYLGNFQRGRQSSARGHEKNLLKKTLESGLEYWEFEEG